VRFIKLFEEFVNDIKLNEIGDGGKSFDYTLNKGKLGGYQAYSGKFTTAKNRSYNVTLKDASPNFFTDMNANTPQFGESSHAVRFAGAFRQNDTPGKNELLANLKKLDQSDVAMYDIDFTADGTFKETNDGEMYPVMGTVVKMIKEVYDKESPKKLFIFTFFSYPKPGETAGSANKRTKLYLAFFKMSGMTNFKMAEAQNRVVIAEFEGL